MLVIDEVLIDKEAEQEQQGTECPVTLNKLFRQAEQNIAAGRVIVFEGNDWMSFTPEQLKAAADKQRRHWPQ